MIPASVSKCQVEPSNCTDHVMSSNWDNLYVRWSTILTADNNTGTQWGLNKFANSVVAERVYVHYLQNNGPMVINNA